MQEAITFILKTFNDVSKLLFNNALLPYSNSRVSLGSLFVALGFITILLSVFWKGGHK